VTEELNVGSPAPDFTLPAGDGREIRLSDYRGKAAVVLFFVREYN
jgi:peroxiredoxin